MAAWRRRPIRSVATERARREGAPVSKGYEIAEEGQPPGLMQRREAFEKQPPEQARQRPDGQEEAGLAGDPARTVRRQAAAGHNHVHVRVVSQSRAPGVQHGGEANASPQVFWVGRNGDQRLGGGPEQQVVDDCLVLERDWRDRGRQGEDEVIVGDRQQIVSLGFQPLSRRRALGLRAMMVPARVVGDLTWAQSLQRSTCPPSAAVRQVSIADMTFNWPRLTWPALALHHAEP